MATAGALEVHLSAGGKCHSAKRTRYGNWPHSSGMLPAGRAVQYVLSANACYMNSTAPPSAMCKPVTSKLLAKSATLFVWQRSTGTQCQSQRACLKCAVRPCKTNRPFRASALTTDGCVVDVNPPESHQGPDQPWQQQDSTCTCSRQPGVSGKYAPGRCATMSHAGQIERVMSAPSLSPARLAGLHGRARSTAIMLSSAFTCGHEYTGLLTQQKGRCRAGWCCSAAPRSVAVSW